MLLFVDLIHFMIFGNYNGGREVMRNLLNINLDEEIGTALILLFYTFSLMVIGLYVAATFSHEAVIVPSGLLAAYAAILPIYTAKNTHDFALDPMRPSRKGHRIVYVWVVAFIAAAMAAALWPDAAAVAEANMGMARQNGFHIPGGMTPLFIEVIGIFVGGRVLKDRIQKVVAVGA